MELSVLDKKGKETGRKIKLDQAVFGIDPNNHAIYLDVKQHLANRRQGTHKSKERAEIVGSTRKIKKQKGTGTARAGSIKNPLFRGGGRIFGPTPRDYTQKVNKKVMQMFEKAEHEYTELKRKKDVVETDKSKIREVMDELDEKKREALETTWKKVDGDLGSIFSTLLPGTTAKLEPVEGTSFMDGESFHMSE